MQDPWRQVKVEACSLEGSSDLELKSLDFIRTLLADGQSIGES
jgi:hypothetical protein